MRRIPQITSDRSRVPGLLLLSFFALGISVVALATPHGLGYGYDSIFYWSGAVNLLDGNGLSRLVAAGGAVPITHFPPLYPSLLALGSKLTGTEVPAVARSLAALLFAANLAIVWALIRRATDSALAASLAGLILLTAPSIVDRHLWAMSEPLYFALMLLAVWGLAQSTVHSDRRWLAVAAGAAGLAYLTRYAGLAVIASGVAVLLLGRDRPVRERLKRAGIFSALALAPGVAWQLRNQLAAGTLSNRVVGWHPPTAEQLRTAGATLASWLPLEVVPTAVRAVLVGSAGLLIVAVLIRSLTRDSEPSPARALLVSSTMHGAVYVAFLLISLTFYDASTRLNPRILSPLYLVGLLSAALIGWRGYARYGSRALALGWIGISLILVLSQTSQSLALLHESAGDGLGFSSSAWRESETIQAVEQLDGGLALYSNEALPVYFLTGRPASSVPERTDPVKGGARADYPQLLAGMRSRLEAGEAALVLFHPDALGPELPDLTTLTHGLSPALVADDGTIYLQQDRADG